MPTWSRRRIETILLAVLAIAAVGPLRFFVESRGWILAELATMCLAFLVVEVVKTYGDGQRALELLAILSTVILAFCPILFAFAARALGSPIAFEMSMLTTFGAVSLAVAVSATTHRIQSMSLVMSGFLVLFCASISDSDHAAVLPLVWMLGCVWHLVANHWERLDLAMPDSVQRTWLLRPSVMIITLLVLVAGGFAVKDRMSSRRLAFGWMPTSGGSQWSDPAARDGVGTGDAAIAAKDHAESFGAVDSELLLESNEPTLYDMFNDMLGDPKKQEKRSERAQAIGNENFIPSHERSAKSEQGGGTFSTERMPPKKHQHLKAAEDASVVQWDGPTGIRLAMQRYDTFDGRDWFQTTNHKNEKLTRVDIDKAAWFFDPLMRGALVHAPDMATVGLLKIIRLDSQRLPVPMLTAGVHIKDIDRQDFYGISEDGSFFMPGREKVPPLTVVHVASVSLIEDEIHNSLSIRESEFANLAQTDSATSPADVMPGSQVAGRVNPSFVADQLVDYVEKWTIGIDEPYEKLRAIVTHLRTEFTFVRDSETIAISLDEFLQSRRGGDHLFATTAALMSQQIGLSSRLVTGFYVRPDSFEIAAGHASVLPNDVHVWTEVQLDDGRWFEIEPTPGYEQPRYQPSWRLRARRYAAAYWPMIVGGTFGLACVYVSRRFLIDWSLTLIWNLARWLRPQRRIRLAIRIIEMRARLVGQRRPVGTSQRAWLEQLTRADATIASVAQQFSDAADVLFFGHGNEPSNFDATHLVNRLRLQTIAKLTKEATS